MPGDSQRVRPTASNGQEAVGLWQETGLDVVLTDIRISRRREKWLGQVMRQWISMASASVWARYSAMTCSVLLFDVEMV